MPDIDQALTDLASRHPGVPCYAHDDTYCGALGWSAPCAYTGALCPHDPAAQDDSSAPNSDR